MRKILYAFLVAALLCGCSKSEESKEVTDLNVIGTEVESTETVVETLSSVVPESESAPESSVESESSEEPEDSPEPEAIVTTAPIQWNEAFATAYFNDATNFWSVTQADITKDHVTIRIGTKVLDIYTNVDAVALDSMFNEEDNLMTNYSVDGGSMHSWYYSKEQIRTTNLHVISTDGKFKETNLSGACIVGMDEEVASIDDVTLLTAVDDVLERYGTPTHFECNGEYPYFNLFLVWENYDNYVIEVSYTVMLNPEDVMFREDHVDYIRVTQKVK